jgi:uncharacterized membrane protein YkoI
LLNDFIFDSLPMSNSRHNENHKKKIIRYSLASGAAVFLMAILIAGTDVSQIQAFAQTIPATDSDQSTNSIMSPDDEAAAMTIAASDNSASDPASSNGATTTATMSPDQGNQNMQSMGMIGGFANNANMTARIFPRNFTGTVPVISAVSNFLNNYVKVSLAQAIRIAQLNAAGVQVGGGNVLGAIRSAVGSNQSTSSGAQSGSNQSIALAARFTTVQGFWAYRVIVLGSDGMLHAVLVDPGNGKVLDSHSISLRQAIALHMLRMHRMERQDQGAQTSQQHMLARIIILHNLLQRALANQRDLQGSLPIGQSLVQFLQNNLNTSLAQAVNTAQQNAGGNGQSFTIGARLTIVNGYFVYRVTALGSDKMIHLTLVDPGNGQVLASRSFTLYQLVALRALAERIHANRDSDRHIQRPGLMAIMSHMRGNNPG